MIRDDDKMMQRACALLAMGVGDKLPPDVAFVLVIAELNAPHRQAYASNLPPESATKIMQGVIDEHKAGDEEVRLYETHESEPGVIREVKVQP